MLKLTDGISRNIDKEAAIPPAVLDELNIQMKKGLGFSDVLSAGIAGNECWYQASKERLEETYFAPLSDEIRMKGLMLALSGTLTLYDTYMAYTDIAWPTSKVAGRYAISPDNVAFKAINNGPLKLVTFYHDGKRIDDNAEALMEELMQVK
jgi:hypothetical protein